MNDRSRDGETQQFEETYDTADFLAAISEFELASTGDVADHVGCDRVTAWRRLKTLEEEETVESTPVGGSKVWRVAEDTDLSDMR